MLYYVYALNINVHNIHVYCQFLNWLYLCHKLHINIWLFYGYSLHCNIIKKKTFDQFMVINKNITEIYYGSLKFFLFSPFEAFIFFQIYKDTKCMYDIKRCNTYQHLMFVNACCSYLRTFRAVVCVCWGVVSGEKLMDGLYRVVHLFATLLSQADQL